MQASLTQRKFHTTKAVRVKTRDWKLSNTDLAQILKKLKLDLDRLQNNFDITTDPVLIDSYIYEIMSINMKYKFYLNLCKERGIAIGL